MKILVQIILSFVYMQLLGISENKSKHGRHKISNVGVGYVTRLGMLHITCITIHIVYIVYFRWCVMDTRTNDCTKCLYFHVVVVYCNNSLVPLRHYFNSVFILYFTSGFSWSYKPYTTNTLYLVSQFLVSSSSSKK